MSDQIQRAPQGDKEIVFQKAKKTIESNEAKIRAALPEIVRANADDFMRALMVDLHKNEKLAAAAASNPVGFVSCILDGARTGLRFGPFGHLNILPFWSNKKRGYDLSLVIGYKGYNELALGTGKVNGISKHCVFDGEPFDLVYGVVERLDHRPRWDVPREKENCIGAYAVAFMTSGLPLFKFVSKAEILRVAKDNDVWGENWEAMFEKTAVRRLANMLPMTAAFQEAIELDDKHAKHRYEELGGAPMDVGSTVASEAQRGPRAPSVPTVTVEPSRPADKPAPKVEEQEATRNATTTQAPVVTAPEPPIAQESAGASQNEPEATSTAEPAPREEGAAPSNEHAESTPGCAPGYVFTDYDRDAQEAIVCRLIDERDLPGDAAATKASLGRKNDTALATLYAKLCAAPVRQ